MKTCLLHNLLHAFIKIIANFTPSQGSAGINNIFFVFANDANRSKPRPTTKHSSTENYYKKRLNLTGRNRETVEKDGNPIEYRLHRTRSTTRRSRSFGFKLKPNRLGGRIFSQMENHARATLSNSPFKGLVMTSERPCLWNSVYPNFIPNEKIAREVTKWQCTLYDCFHTALNEALKKEDERLKIATGEVMTRAGEKL
ncbi:hypothetical protein SO802_010800 [Lithocarpus litseifolius]|uniref:Uncharacterized protein n=1 Tax=Lithocarpus litseifolius TaxID=425828 RepID=A0AAW2DHU9_9ROSI